MYGAISNVGHFERKYNKTVKNEIAVQGKEILPKSLIDTLDSHFDFYQESKFIYTIFDGGGNQLPWINLAFHFWVHVMLWITVSLMASIYM